MDGRGLFQFFLGAVSIEALRKLLDDVHAGKAGLAVQDTVGLIVFITCVLATEILYAHDKRKVQERLKDEEKA